VNSITIDIKSQIAYTVSLKVLLNLKKTESFNSESLKYDIILNKIASTTNAPDS